MNELVEVRCPLKNKKGEQDHVCNKLAVRVRPGASGIAYCPAHKQEFEFVVVDQARSESLPFVTNDKKFNMEKQHERPVSTSV